MKRVISTCVIAPLLSLSKSLKLGWTWRIAFPGRAFARPVVPKVMSNAARVIDLRFMVVPFKLLTGIKRGWWAFPSVFIEKIATDNVTGLILRKRHYVAGMNDAPQTRPVKPALLRGWKRCCPACGNGPLLRGYLGVNDQCAVCREELHHHRADDGPAWATIIISGHLLAPMMLLIFEIFRPEGWVMASGFSIFFVILALFLLPRVKGMFVALQWAKRMHGFGG